MEKIAPSGMFCSLIVYWKSSKRKTGYSSSPPVANGKENAFARADRPSPFSEYRRWADR